jgi:hypothetical protein
MGTRSNKYAEAMAGSGNMTPVEKVSKWVGACTALPGNERIAEFIDSLRLPRRMAMMYVLSCYGFLSSDVDMPQGHDAILSKILTLESVTVEPTA